MGCFKLICLFQEETGIDESASRKLTEVKANKNDNDTNSDTDNEESRNRENSPIAPALLHLRGRKKSKKLTNLDISSDDGSDEDFKGPSYVFEIDYFFQVKVKIKNLYFSDEDDDFDEDLSEYSDDSVKKRPQPTRRSVRNRKNVVDPDFSKYQNKINILGNELSIPTNYQVIFFSS